MTSVHLSLLLCLLSTLGSARATCAPGCKCSWTTELLDVWCAKSTSSKFPKLASIKTGARQVTFYLYQPGLLQVKHANFPLGFNLRHVIIDGEERTRYDENAFASSVYTLQSLDLIVGAYTPNRVFAPVASLRTLHRLRLVCSGDLDDDVSMIRPMVSGFVKRSLKQLTLESCRITSIAPQVFSELKNLEELALPDNRLHTVPFIARSLPLISINLNRNRLLRLEKLQFPLTLRHLYVSRNELRSVDPETFANKPDLSVIDLSHNAHLTLPTGVFESVKTGGHVNLTKTGVWSLDLTNRTSLSDFTLVILHARIHCNCQLFFYLKDQSNSIFGTCLTNTGKKLTFPGSELRRYLQTIDCSCLTTTERLCTSREWMEMSMKPLGKKSYDAHKTLAPLPALSSS